MNMDALRDYCLSFPQAKENLQWGDDLCFKVGGKIFVMLSLPAVPQKLCFKCTPEKFAELTERPGIHPAPYVGRYSWVILDLLDALSREELKDLIRESYEMVAAKPPKVRPRKSVKAKKVRATTARKTRANRRRS